MPIVFVKNTTIVDIVIEDLGIIIPGSSITNLTETFEFYEITSSDDLKNQISAGDLIINDGEWTPSDIYIDNWLSKE